MSSQAKLIPASSQTVGPFFTIGLESLTHDAPTLEPGSGATIAIRGMVLDRDRAPVPDALLEFWTANCNAGHLSSVSEGSEFPQGFRRASTDLDGKFMMTIKRPEALRMNDGSMQAPHLLVLLFARGLMRHLVTRVYFENHPGNASDPVLLGIPVERRRTLIARQEANGAFCWDVILQGADETVFFAW